MALFSRLVPALLVAAFSGGAAEDSVCLQEQDAACSFSDVEPYSKPVGEDCGPDYPEAVEERNLFAKSVY